MNRLAQIVRIARCLFEDSQVPYAFEKRVMAVIRSSAVPDMWSMWLPTMKKAAVCGIGILLLTVAYIRYSGTHSPDLLAGDLERTVLASVTSDETW